MERPFGHVMNYTVDGSYSVSDVSSVIVVTDQQMSNIQGQINKVGVH